MIVYSSALRNAIAVGIEKIKHILSENYVKPDQSEYVKSKIKENGQYTIIDKITVYFDDHEDKYMNGVLFIDEAYGLVSSGTSSSGVTSYGEEAIAVLLKEMEDHRGQFCVILAGYREEMKTMISATNPCNTLLLSMAVGISRAK